MSNFRDDCLRLVCGAGSGCVTKTFVSPLERIKILFQLQAMSNEVKPKYTGIAQALRLVRQEEGLRGWWVGNGANCLRVGPVYALKFAFNDAFKRFFGEPAGEDGKYSFMQLIGAGTLAGLVQSVVTYPLETVRTRLSIGPALGIEYKGITDCIRQTVRAEGVAGLYKGVGVTILTGAPYVGLQMTFFELINDRKPEALLHREGWLGSAASVLWILVSGATAGLAAQSLMYPGDTLRRRLQTNGANGAKPLYNNTWHCIKTMIRNEGIMSFYFGWGTNAVRCLPGASIQFVAYKGFKYILDVK